MTRKNSAMMGISLDKEVFADFQRVCAEKCINKSMLVNKLIADWLKENDSKTAKKKGRNIE